MIRFKDIPKEEKPRERLVKYGEKYLSNEELLCILLKTGTKKYNVKVEVLSSLKRVPGTGGPEDRQISDGENHHYLQHIFHARCSP